MKLNIPEPVTGIIERLTGAGFEAVLCGGCVRDFLLGVEPADWDVATSALPDEIENLFDKTIPVGKAFGVVRVLVDGTDYEVATFRKDSATGDGRRPDSVEFSTPEEDVKRRDLTINGLLYDVKSKEVLDYVGGEQDIAAKVIRFIGNPVERIREDYLRIIRAIRFAANLGFEIEAETRQAIKENAGLVKLVSAERIADELKKMLCRGGAGLGLRLLEELNVLRFILPEISAMLGMPQPEEFHPEGDVFEHTAIMLDMLEKGCDPRLAFAVLLHDVGKPDTLQLTDRIRFHYHEEAGARLAEKILLRLKMPNAFTHDVCALIAGHMRMAHLKEMRKAKLRRMLQDPLFPLHMELHRLDCTSSHGKLDVYEFAKNAKVEEDSRPPEPEKILGGDDLLNAGYEAGPRFKEILEFVQDSWLEGTVKDKEEALQLVQKNYPL